MSKQRQAASSVHEQEPRTPALSEASLKGSIDRLARWVETHDYKAYEPFDGLSSYLGRFTFGSRVLGQLLLQLGRQSPVNFRPLLGIKPLELTKGRGYMAWGYLTLLKLTGREEYRQQASACLEWLIRNTSPRYSDASWGNHFDYAS